MDAKDIKAAFEQHGIRRVKLGGFDIDGLLRGKYISLAKFWSAIDQGFGFCDVIFGWDISDTLYDNGNLTGWHTGFPDLQAKIDLDSFRVLPTEPETASFLVDFYDNEGKPFAACPRNLLKKVTDQAKNLGFRARFGVEFEFWVFQESPDTVTDKQFSNLQPLSPGMFGYSWLRQAQHQPWITSVLDGLDAFGIPVEGLHTETGPGVYEVAIHHADPLTAADNAALFKVMLKQIAYRHGLTVSFMAKWHPDLPGSSGHLHQSLWNHALSENQFAEPSGQLSELAQHYLAGQLATMQQLTALYSPTINSYKRYVPGVWAPLSASWGYDNRTCAIRVLGNSRSSTRFEFRQTAADINPFIAIATCLASGMHGVNEKLAPPPCVKGDATEYIQESDRLPGNLRSAVELLQQSKVAGKILGDDFVDHYVRTRLWEIRQYELQVSTWELRRYFEAI